MLRALLLLLTLTSTISFNLSPPSRPTTSLSSRRTFLSTSTSFLSTAALTTLFPQIGLAAADDADRVKVEKMKTAKSGAPTPSIGELAAIRFKGEK
ncbi:hypothetical protein TL16_g08974 [Triparma laevis f. inornata]|uniref:Uncharacterized protein n=1 Tax=Triparma laevis f. inornata TaxID=1714386 RepID=A0A9W7AZ78_9STRA|nr:hypothetical protein TL16_g08974 [Triparma laevis f. inornata]